MGIIESESEAREAWASIPSDWFLGAVEFAQITDELSVTTSLLTNLSVAPTTFLHRRTIKNSKDTEYPASDAILLFGYFQALAVIEKKYEGKRILRSYVVSEYRQRRTSYNEMFFLSEIGRGIIAKLVKLRS